MSGAAQPRLAAIAQPTASSLSPAQACSATTSAPAHPSSVFFQRTGWVGSVLMMVMDDDGLGLHVEFAQHKITCSQAQASR